MPIKYAEITIIINEENLNMLNYLSVLLLGSEIKASDNDNIIILFDDESVYDIKNIENIKSHKNFNMGPEYCKRRVPIHFEIDPLKLYFFSKSPTEINGILKLDFKPIFSNSQKFITSKRVASEFNVVYYQLFKKEDGDSLAIVKIKSNETKPRFLVAYDDTYFEKEDIIYFINYIFSKK